MRAAIAIAAVAMVAFCGAVARAQQPSLNLEEEHFEALAAELANGSKNIQLDLGPLLDVLKDEIHNFVEQRSDEESTHKLVTNLLEDMIAESEDEEVKKHMDDFQSFEAFSGLLDVVGVPHGEPVEDEDESEEVDGEKRKMGLAGRIRSGLGVVAGGFGGGNVMIPPGTFVGGSPFIGLNPNPSLTPFTYTGTGLRALPAELQQKFNDFYNAFCVQAGISADAGQYNFPGFDLGSIEIEVKNGGCTVDQGNKQLVCSPGSISYTKAPASLNGFSKNGMDYQGSYCPGITFPKKKETSFSASVGGTDRTVLDKRGG